MRTPRTPSKFEVIKLSLEPFKEEINKRFREVFPKAAYVDEPGFCTYDTHGAQGVVKTLQGYVRVCDEGVIDAKPISNENPLVIPIYTSRAAGFSMYPWMEIKLQPDNVEKCLTKETKPLHEFIRTFGSRLESNYIICEDHLTTLNKKKRLAKSKKS